MYFFGKEFHDQIMAQENFSQVDVSSQQLPYDLHLLVHLKLVHIPS